MAPSTPNTWLQFAVNFLCEKWEAFAVGRDWNRLEITWHGPLSRIRLLRIMMLAMVGLIWGGASLSVEGSCGLDGALRELRLAALQSSRDAGPQSLRPGDWAKTLPLGGTCSGCHLAGFGGPRNELGTAFNTLLTFRDRRDPVRQRDLGRRIQVIVANPALPDSPTFGQWFLQGGAMAAGALGPAAGLAAADLRNREPLDVVQAEQLVSRAQADSRFGILQLSRTSQISPAVARVLANYRGEALILGIDSVTPEVAGALAESQAQTLWLPAVTRLSPAAAQALSQRAGRLVLTGLTHLDSVALAQKLATNSEAVSFPYLQEIDSDVAGALARTQRSLTLAGLTRPSPAVQERLAATAGALSLPNLRTLDSQALAKKLANSVVLLPRIETLTVPQAAALIGIRGQESFFGGIYLPIDVVTPEIAQVLAASPKSINLILLGRQVMSDEALRTLLNSRLNVTLADVETLSTPQVQLIAQSLVQAKAEPGVVSFPRLRMQNVQSLESAVLADTLGRLNQYQFPGVRRISVAAATALGSGPTAERRLSDGSRQLLLSNLNLPDLEELSPETAQQLFQKRWAAIQLPSLQDVSSETLQRLAPQTSSLSLGITTLPEEFAEALAAVSSQPQPGGGSLKLPRLKNLSPAAARRLIDGLNRGVQELRAAFGERVALPKLELGDDVAAPGDGLESLTPDVARQLARFEGSLTLAGLAELPDESAIALASYTGPYLTLSGPAVEQLSPTAAAALAEVPGVLRIALRHLDSVALARRFAGQLNWTLYDLESISAAAAAELIAYRPFFNLDALTSLETVELADRFVRGNTGGGRITLQALGNLSPAAAERLAQGSKTMLLGLTVLDDPATARALAGCSAGVELPRLRAVTPAVREILGASTSIKAPPLESLYLLSETNPLPE
jgi:hypothetical protein